MEEYSTQKKLANIQNKINKNINQQFHHPQQFKVLSNQMLKCINNHEAYIACLSKNCSHPALICQQSNCQLVQNHIDCHHILVKKLIKNINMNQKNVSQQVKQTFQLIIKKINQMIDQLSELRLNFQYELKFYGLKKHQIIFMKLITQEKYNNINGQLISQLQQSFSEKIQFSMLKAQQLQKKFIKQTQSFNEILQNIKIKYSKIGRFMLQNFLKDSKILQKQEDIQKIIQWMTPIAKNNLFKMKSKLLFRASQHQFKSSQFIKHCDGKQNTLVIIKTEFGKIIGGFTPCKRQSTSYKQIQDLSKTSFMFSLSLNQKYQLINSKNAISCSSGYGPRFGGGSADLYISDQANTNSSCYSQFPICYNKQNGKYSIHSQNSNNPLLTGTTNGKNWKVNQYQVYQIINLQKQ